MTRHVPDSQVFWVIRQYLYWPKFFLVIFLFLPLENVHFQLFSFHRMGT